jgi:hypothetical protein
LYVRKCNTHSLNLLQHQQKSLIAAFCIARLSKKKGMEMRWWSWLVERWWSGLGQWCSHCSCFSLLGYCRPWPQNLSSRRFAWQIGHSCIPNWRSPWRVSVRIFPEYLCVCGWILLALQIQPNVCISLCSSALIFSIFFTFLLQCKVGLISLLLFQHLCVHVCVCVCVCAAMVLIPLV